MRLTLREAREKRDWTPEELAEHAGVHRATIYRIEAGATPNYATLQALETALKVKPGTLVFGDAVEARAS